MPLLLLEDIEVERNPFRRIAEFQDIQVKAHRRKGKMVRAFRRKGRKGGEGNSSRNALMVGAAVAGLSLVAYAGLRAKYRMGFAKSAEMAKKLAQGMDAPLTPKGKTQATFVASGFTGVEGRSASNKIVNMLGRKNPHRGSVNWDNHHLIAVDRTKFNPAPPWGSSVAEKKAFKARLDSAGGIKKAGLVAGSYLAATRKMFGTGLENVLKTGRNPAAVDLAAETYAYSLKNPGVPINLVGHSAGGMVAAEAAEILKRLGVRTKVATAGTPSFGINKPVGPFLSYTSTRDFVFPLPSVGKKVYVNSVKDHFANGFFGNLDFQKDLKNFLG